jgi:predicted XRE-type DNA-binding protein
MIMSAQIMVTPSSGNVFADLGLKNAEERLAKAQLAMRIAAAIKARKLTQLAAAEVCGIDQPKISKLMRGDLYGFSTDQLLRFLTALGQDVEIIVRDRPRRRGSVKGKLTVRAA